MLCSMGCILYEVVVQCGFQNDRSRVQKTFYISVIPIIGLASHAGAFRGVWFSYEKRAPRKTPAWETIIGLAVKYSL